MCIIGYRRCQIDIKDLQNRFVYHPPKDGQNEKYKEIRMNALNLAILINDLVPDSREKSLAITHLEECVMFANAGIARQE